MATPTTLEQWMTTYGRYAKTGAANLKKFQTSLAAEKKKHHPNSARIKYFEKQIGKVTTEVGHWKDQIASTQNKIYVREGQYGNLLKGTERDAYMAVQALFKSYGLDSLAGKIYDYVKNGYSGDTISILLQDSKEYKTRFAGNEARKAKGLPVLSAGEYLATEASYKQIMQEAGMPVGYYDSHSDFNDLIGRNVSPSEVQKRVDLATQATRLSNPSYRKALNAMGISDNDLTAYFMDKDKALPFLQKSAATAAVGAAALGQGLTFDKSYAEELALEGINAEQAQQGYSNVAQELDTMKALGSIYGEAWNQRTSEQGVFQGNAEAVRKKQKLLSQEKGSFSGAAGAARGGLSQGGGAK